MAGAGHTETQVDTTDWWTEQWHRSMYEAQVLDTFLADNQEFNSSTFHEAVLHLVEGRG